MKRSIKSTFAFVLTILMVLSIVGCSNPGSSSGDSVSTEAPTEAPAVTEGDAQPYAGTILTVLAVGDHVKDIDRTLAQQFSDETGITVEFQLYPIDQYNDVLGTRIATSEAPDIFYVSSGSALIPYKDFLLDLSGEEWVGRMNDSVKPGASIDGALYGLNMWSQDCWSVLYNTQIFEQYGLGIPTSWDDFLNICQTLSDNDVRPIYEPGKDGWHFHDWTDAGLVGYLLDTDPNVATKLNNNEIKYAEIPALVTAVERYKQLFDLGYFGDTVLSDTWDGSYEAMGTGKAAMVLTWGSYAETTLGMYPDSGAGEWKMFANPLYDPSTVAVTAGGILRCAYRDGKNVDAVKLYFDFLTREENLQAYYDGRDDLAVPSFASVTKDMPVAWMSLVDTYDASRFTVGSDLVTYYEGWNWGSNFQELILGTLTPVQLLENFDKERAASALADDNANWK